MPHGVDAWPDQSGLHAGITIVGDPEDEVAIQRVEEEVNRIAALVGPQDSSSVSSGDPPAKRVRCESGVETDRLSDSSD